MIAKRISPRALIRPKLQQLTNSERERERKIVSESKLKNKIETTPMICPHGPLRGDYYRKDPSEVAKAVCEGISEKYHVASNYSTVGDVLNRASKSKGKRVYTWRKYVVWPSESLAFYFAIRGRSVRELLL